MMSTLWQIVVVGDAVVVDGFGFEVGGSSVVVVVVVGLTLGEVELYVIGVGRWGMTPLLLLFGKVEDDVGTGDDDGANDNVIGEIAGGSILSMTPWPLSSSIPVPLLRDPYTPPTVAATTMESDMMKMTKLRSRFCETSRGPDGFKMELMLVFSSSSKAKEEEVCLSYHRFLFLLLPLRLMSCRHHHLLLHLDVFFFQSVTVHWVGCIIRYGASMWRC